MKQLLRNSLITLAFCYVSSISSTSLVYNLRIRRTFAGLGTFLQHVTKEKKAHWVTSAVPILYARTGHFTNATFGTNVREKRLGGGAIFNARYIPSRAWWAEATTAIQKESVHSRGTANFDASRFGLDDIVLAAGHNAFPSERSQITLYALAGFPTRRRVTAQEAQDRLVGTRFYGLGGGLEGSYNFIDKEKQSLAGIAQLRVLYFFPRSWNAIIPGGRIQPGFATDILLAIRYRTGLTAVEAGYNPTIFTGQALIAPTVAVRSKPATRHGLLISVMHLCRRVTIANHPVAFGAGILFSRLARFDANSVSPWVNMTIIF